MSGLEQRLVQMIRQMVGLPNGVPFNPVAALEAVASRVVTLHGAVQAMKVDRIVMRQVLTGIAFDFGMREGHLDDLVLLQWPLDPKEPVTPEEFEEQQKEASKPKVQEAKGLVSLH